MLTPYQPVHFSPTRSQRGTPSPPRAVVQHLPQRQPQVQVSVALDKADTAERESVGVSVAALTPSIATPIRSLSASTLSVAPTSQPVTPIQGGRVVQVSGVAAGWTTPPVATYPLQSMTTMPAAPTVHVPLSVLAHLDQKIGEMSSELIELQEAEKHHQEISGLDNHLMVMRHILNDDLMRNHEKKNLDEGNFLSDLDVDHAGPRRHARDLQEEKRKMCIENEDLKRTRAALELECESRLHELKSLGGAAAAAEDAFLQRIKQLTTDSLQLKDRVLTAESNAETEKSVTIEACQKLKKAETELSELKVELKEVVNTARQLREKVYELEAEKQQQQELQAKSDELERRLSNSKLLEEQPREHSPAKQQLIQELQAKRQLIQELQDKLQSLQASQTQASRSTDIANLEQQLDLAKGECDMQVREVRRLKQQASEYESQLEVLRTAEGKCSQQQVKHTTRLEELEKLLDEAQTSETNHGRQASALRLKTQDLEQELANLKIASDGQARRLKAAQDANNDLSGELEKVRTSESDNARKLRASMLKGEELKAEVETLRRAEEKISGQVKTLNVKVADLEPRLEKAEDEYQKQLIQNTNHHERTSKMEDELKRYKDLDASHSRNHKELKKKNDELGNKVQESTDRLENLQRQLSESEERCKEVEKINRDLERQNKDFERQYKDLERQLQDYREERDKQNRQLELHQEKVRQAQTDVQLHQEKLSQAQTDFQQMSNRYKEVENINRDLERKKEDLERQNKDLERERPRSTERSIMEPSVSASARSLVSDGVVYESLLPTSPQFTTSSRELVRPERKKSLYGEVASSKSHLMGELLPYESDPFVKKVREEVSKANRVLRDAMDVQKKCFGEEMQRLSKASMSGGNDLRTIANSGILNTFSAERRSEADKVQAILHSLNAINAESQLERQLPQEVAERIEFDIHRCHDYLVQLREEAPLEDIPTDILQMLLGVHEGKVQDFPGGTTPMHWAAKHGRRDMMEYLLDKGGRLMLQLHDSTGHTPLYYAQLGSHMGLIEWMTQELKVDAPVHKKEVPEFSDIPDCYAKILEKICESGWRSIKWKENYTMLHWAATKGRKDICQYLVTFDADPGAKDTNGKSAIDIAGDAQNTELVSILKELKLKRRASRKPVFR